MKVCVTCHEAKALEAFNLRRSARDGRQDRCRDCCKKWYAEHDKPHRAAVAARAQRLLDEQRQLVVDYLLEHPCVDCGEGDVRVLEFDHRPGVEKRAPIALLVRSRHSWGVVEAEIAKCDVRCANCHRRKTGERGLHWRHRWYLRQQTEFDPADRLARIFRAAP